LSSSFASEHHYCPHPPLSSIELPIDYFCRNQLTLLLQVFYQPNPVLPTSHVSTSFQQRSYPDKAIRAIQRQIGKEGLNLDVRDFYQTNTATCAHTQQVVYMGIAIAESDHDANELVIGVTTHDGTYSIGYESHHYPPKQGFNLGEVSVALDNGSGADVSMAEDDQAPQSPSSQINLVDYVINMVNDHRLNNHYKIAGGAITKQAAALCPELASALWRELDIVCFIFKPFGDEDEACEGTEEKVDEESDSVARKAIE
jgi:hypothetical protein